MKSKYDTIKIKGEFMSNIFIVDAMMGSGKTTWAINKMNQDTKNKYLYITPYLSEIERIQEQCNNKFYDPQNDGYGKLDHLHQLLIEGKNVASTHALFKTFTRVTEELILDGNYTLILDEVVDIIEQIQLQKDDLPSILKLELTKDNKYTLAWNDDNLDYEGRYDDIKEMALNNSLVMFQQSALFWNFPISIFKSFKEVYIMTYMFDGQFQKYYYDFHNVDYQYIQPFESHVVLDKNNINIIEDFKLNSIGKDYYSLSVGWFKRYDNKVLFKVLQNNIYNFFTHKSQSKSKECMWTTFKVAQENLQHKGFVKSFVSVNARSTNEYGDRSNVAYCANIFVNPIIKQFFKEYNITIDEDKYALSEMLQWIWRSAIRNGKSINLYIPSSRMRNLLKKYLETT
jgi:hypothetical protein